MEPYQKDVCMICLDEPEQNVKEVHIVLYPTGVRPVRLATALVFGFRLSQMQEYTYIRHLLNISMQ